VTATAGADPAWRPEPAIRTTGPDPAELRALWTAVLHREPTSDDEDFFDLGGHSLSLVQMLALVRDRYGVELRMDELFADDITIRTVEAMIHRLLADHPEAP
jgi:acyl carrier protein